MSARTSLQARVALYIAERTRLGYCPRDDACALRSFARHVQTTGHRGPLTREVMAEWARCDSRHSSDPHTWAWRLKKLRSFMRWLQQFEPRTEVPDNAIFGCLPERQTPHIYSEQEIVDLLAAARRLGPAPGLGGIVFETLFGLLASTGLRIGEALALRNVDVDLKAGMLSIHQTKFGKSRQVPMHPTTLDALRRYRWMRDLCGEQSETDDAFFIGTRGRRRGLPLADRQVHRVFGELRTELGWHNRGTHHAARIHDLRHTFVVRRIVQWQAQGVDIDQAMLSLSTYVGHAKVTNTYWYLSSVPQIMALAASRFESIREMALRSDILVENFKVGGLKQYGLDFEGLQALNPRLIYCSVTGFGQDGPYAERAGYDLMMQAMTGLMSITGRSDDVPGGGPQRVGVAVIDLFTGVYACSAILAALEVRHRTGTGQHIDMALLDVGMAMLANQGAGFLNTGKVPPRQGNSHPSLAPYQDFQTLDGSMLLAIGNDGQFARFCEVAGRPAWALDARFASNTLRVQNREVLSHAMQAVTQTRTTAQWIALLENKAVPCGAINDIGQAFADAQVKARSLVLNPPMVPVTTALEATETVAHISTVASPLRLMATPPVLRRAPPTLGQHSAEVLAELGLDAAQVAARRQAGVV